MSVAGSATAPSSGIVFSGASGPTSGIVDFSPVATSTSRTGPTRMLKLPVTSTASEIWKMTLSAETPTRGVPSKSRSTGAVVVPVRTS